MEVQFTDDQMAFVRRAIDSGRYSGEEDASRDALSLLEIRERRRAEILAAVAQAETSVSPGPVRRSTTAEETSQLAEEIKRRGLSRLVALAEDRHSSLLALYIEGAVKSLPPSTSPRTIMVKDRK